jgi:hypothetical protein
LSAAASGESTSILPVSEKAIGVDTVTLVDANVRLLGFCRTALMASAARDGLAFPPREAFSL